MIKKSRKKLGAAILAVGVVSGAGVAYSSIQSPEIKTVYSHASWNYSYGSIEELAQDSDLVALVTVGEKISEKSVDHIPMSDFEATVVKPIINSEKGQKISITQTGGLTEVNGEKIKMELEDDPLLVPGEEYVIFARKNDNGTYAILGGPQGRLKNINGKLHAMKYVTKRVGWGNIEVKGENLENLKSKVVKAKKQK